jgi:hypothetical protein
MTELTNLVERAVLEAYDFSGCGTIVDGWARRTDRVDPEEARETSRASCTTRRRLSLLGKV